jgi:23S rRNA (cytosine1962-C5)-methyltransferase
MNFLRLNDNLLSVLFQNDEILAIDKPYGINSHTNDSKVGNLDTIHDGLIEIYERQLGIKLHIVHRLDQTTTGVIIFAKTLEAAKKYSEYFFNREVKKTYWFITDRSAAKDEFKIDQVIVHKGKDLEARTEFKLLKKSAGFELWQANPLTGRNHQIRIHAEAGGIPLLGDEKYNGSEYAFLSLHNHRIEFPNGIKIESVPPKYFNDLNILKDQNLAKAVFESDRRDRLYAGSAPDQCFRLVHNKNDYKDLAFTIDQFGQVLVLSNYADQWTDADQKTFQAFADDRQKPIVVRMMLNRGKDAVNKSQFNILPKNQPSELLSEWIANENKINFQIRSDSGLSFGLFLDQRLQRNWVLNNSENKKVLNLFAYTCGFSVAAATGGASEVTSVDTNKNVLNWGRKNFEVNSIPAEAHRFLCRDSLVYLEQAQAKNIKFDLIICDPPSFSRGEKGVFKIETSIESLLKNCLQCLNEKGDLLFSTNYENFVVDDIRKAILKVQKELGLKNLEINCIHSGLDFELIGKRSILKSFLIRLNG